MKTFFNVWIRLLLVLGLTQGNLAANPNPSSKKPNPSMLAHSRQVQGARHALPGSSRQSRRPTRSVLHGPESETVTVYHGTSEDHLASIMDHGVRTDLGNLMKDHGEGFYTTLDLKQAKDWAQRPRFSNRGVVVGFAVKRHELRALKRLSTDKMSETEIKDFLETNRFNGTAAHDVQADIVEGRMLMNVNPLMRNRRNTFNPAIGLVLEGHQLSFHTAAGAHLLDGSRRSVVRLYSE